MILIDGFVPSSDILRVARDDVISLRKVSYLSTSMPNQAIVELCQMRVLHYQQWGHDIKPFVHDKDVPVILA